MSVKSFKFVSPGVFINEIDNSFIPESADIIGPVVIGRSRRGLAMQPVTVQSYSDFVEMFGDTVPGFGGGDIYRNGNYQSPMYGTYAAKAFLNANVAPLTYIRLLGQQTSVGSSAGNAAADDAVAHGEPGHETRKHHRRGPDAVAEGESRLPEPERLEEKCCATGQEKDGAQHSVHADASSGHKATIEDLESVELRG